MRNALVALLVVAVFVLLFVAPIPVVMALNIAGAVELCRRPKCRVCRSRFWVRKTDHLLLERYPVFGCEACHFVCGATTYFVRPEDEAAAVAAVKQL